MKVLIGCEYSGRTRDAFIRRGHDAVSCDLLPTEAPGPHHQGDLLEIIGDGWDLAIFHPTCQFLANSGSKHLYRGMNAANGIDPERWGKMEAAAEFMRRLMDAPIPRVAVENPIMHGHGVALIGRRQDQVIQPWMFGHEEIKATCLWLRGLPPLRPTNNVGPPPADPEDRKAWAKVHRAPPGPDRWKFRSRTLEGIADAYAEQWGGQNIEPTQTRLFV